jgi:chromosome segregation protein
MKFTRLRLSGFKSFVEPTELQIEAGLTGVVGPNGCGKSNLLEALRWVMGESSYKSMRASGMDDVIFSGTAQRPSRNMAEVMLTLSNDDRTAPLNFNDNDVIEVSRRIEREAGSAYRINGKDVRARDVQLMFADASTGARSPALVRQGQIAEIINAKPQARRLILEEAAGITGLHTRRHEAELKLRAAEQNLTRLDDVVGQLETQLNSLKRQARQAQKYKVISADIRKFEAAGLYAAWTEAAQQAGRDTAQLESATIELAEHTRLASEALRHRDASGDLLPGLREDAAAKAAALQRLTQERTALDEEERRAEARRRELEQRASQTAADMAREQEGLADTQSAIARLSAEHETLTAAQESGSALHAEAAAVLQAASDALAAAQDAADATASRLSELAAQRNALARTIDTHRERIARLDREAAEAASRRDAILAQTTSGEDAATLAAAVDAAVAAAQAAESEAGHAEVAVRVARQVESDTRQAHDEARRAADRLQTEIRTLTNLLRTSGGDLWPPLVDTVKVREGFETALGAALGDDIEAASDEAAPVHWRSLPPLDVVRPLPAGAEPLSRFVEAPPALQRRLAHIGVVSRQTGAALQPQLSPGQRLVSREGDVWRWDGFTAAAEAPGAAARRLAERNRLAALEASMAATARAAEEARVQFDAARTSVEQAVRAERERREALRASQSALETARKAQAAHDRRAAEHHAQLSAIEEAIRRIGTALGEASAQLAAAEADLAGLASPDGLSGELAALRDTVNRERAAYAEARARHDGIERDAKARAGRLVAIAGEQEQWQDRLRRTKGQIEALSQRAAETEAGLAELAAIPGQIAARRMALMDLVSVAETERRAAGDALASAETDARSAEQALRKAQDVLSETREKHARLGARLEASRQRHESCEARISEALHCAAEDVPSQAGFDPAEMPHADDIDKRLVALREDRERLGAVNLRAEDEAAETAKQLETLVAERDDLMQAINKLRSAISSLNREGRQRLLDAFGSVNDKFGELFRTLFNGGKAELQLIESDDPLQAGLEIVANPPGKKPTVLSLLSGGEQTLTALALIFAVFLTNPSPICVLDEVDAPLDDPNVERFCNLLDAMLERTETRFLIITHHPLTMARMHRLYGVTMMERGVSQLVSVNLEEAERLKEAS